MVSLLKCIEFFTAKLPVTWVLQGGDRLPLFQLGLFG
jgi:hypothetical protein